MERQFCINWPAIIEEAKYRRKAQRLTQSRLASMAGVSTPTISRFENGEKDIQFSTVMRILTVLGMSDKRNLIFSRKNDYYDPIHRVVIFEGQDNDKEIRCMISKEALADHFSNREKDPFKVFKSNRQKIEHEARRKYLADKMESDGSILLKTEDI